MRPVLKPALRRVWRDATTLQLGVDPRSALVLSGVGATETRLLGALDGSHDHRDVLIAAAVLGIPIGEAERLLALLDGAGVLDDGAARPEPLSELPWAERARLRPDLAALSLSHARPGVGPDILAARRRSAIRVHGGGRLGAQLAGLLAAAGVGHLDVQDDTATVIADAAPGGVSPADAGLPRERAAESVVRRAAPSTGVGALAPGRSPELTVLAGGIPGRAEQDALLRAAEPHLFVAVRETTGVIGPLVVPGASACLRCLDLARTERDPAWPAIVAQLAQHRQRSDDACDIVLATVTAGHAAMQALAFIDHAVVGGTLPATVGGTLELVSPDWRLRRRSWQPHPACGCTWSH
ncbi:MAG: hypothetical protein QOG53_3240 [Frankiales bacterium]|nr:hypothetical protein [Frankiales bacterium]